MILISLVTHNRLDYTKRSLESLKQTTVVPHKIIAVDNASDDGTQEWLKEQSEQGVIDAALLFEDNRYPGAAANAGWAAGMEHLMPDADFLMRSDNDMEYRKGWDEEAMKAFASFQFLGQLGLMNQEQCFEPGKNLVVPRTADNGYEVNVHWTNIGGTHVMRRELWEMGIRYDETPWHANTDGSGNPIPTAQEDVKLSVAIAQHSGYFFANLIPHLCVEMSYGNTDDYFDYYERTFAARGHGTPDRAKDGEVLEEGDSWRLKERGLAR